MNTVIKALVLILTSSVGFASSTFVEKSYVHVRQEGKIQVQCRTGFSDEYASFWCEGSYLAPTSSARFKTSPRSDLHHVKLEVQNSQGLESKEWRLSSRTGKTLWNIPLWGTGGILTQGENKIRYLVQTRNNQTLEEGNFTTTVTTSPVRRCRPIWLNSINSMDCQVPGYACSQLNFERAECKPR